MYLLNIVSLPFPLDSIDNMLSILRYTLFTILTFWYRPNANAFPLSDLYISWILIAF